MVLHTMYENPQAEWIFWCDADTWINPGNNLIYTHLLSLPSLQPHRTALNMSYFIFTISWGIVCAYGHVLAV